MRKQIIIVGIMGALAVAFGAFGAHGLKPLLSSPDLETYQTGNTYHFYHTLAMLGCVLLVDKANPTMIKRAFTAFLFGILLFSGSLYVLAIDELLGISLKFLAFATPLGGVSFIAGWIFIILSSSKK